MRRRIRTPRRLTVSFAALGLTAGLLAVVAPIVSAHATGGPGTAFAMPTGSVAYLNDGVINGEAADSLSWGYQVGADTPVIVDTNGVGDNVYTEVDSAPQTIGPFESPTTLNIFLTDNSCASYTDSPATYWSDLTPYDHVTITGTTAYHMDFLDAGGPPDCAAQNTDRYDGPGIYNFKVDLSFDGLPLQVTKTADVSTVAPSGAVNYTIHVTNPNVTDASISSITDDLPAGFAMVPGTTSGVVSTDPSVSDQHLTWDTTGTTIPGNSAVDLTFQATASADNGDYYNNASATSSDLPVTPSGDTALVTVMPDSCPTSGTLPPGTPANVQAFAGDGSAAVTWDPPDGGGAVDSYIVNTYVSGGGFAPAHAAPVREATTISGTSAQVDGLENGTTYNFTVQATNCAGTSPESSPSNDVTPEAGSSAQVIGDGTLSQSTTTTGSNSPSPDDSTIGVQRFPAGTTGIGTLQELPPTGPSPIRGAVPLSEFCGVGNPCLGNILEAKLHDGTLGPNPAGGIPFYKLKLFLDRTLVRHLGKNVQVWYDGNLADDNDGGGDPSPPITLDPCVGPFDGTPCIIKIRRITGYDLKVVVATQDIDPRLTTSK